ncbi:MAG: dihydropteroate synthase [Chloroflexi bacterium]|nr:dihydropteroate synthase [Chloroflexota bacterium]
MRCRDRVLELGRRTLVMGIVNVTPDSFSGDGFGSDIARAVRHGQQLVADGADLLDVGGESTRPGAAPVSVEEELRRVVPVVEQLVALVAVPISVDTRKPAVARAALGAGAHLVNDVGGFQRQPEIPALAAAAGAAAVAMHMRGSPETMQRDVWYEDVIAEVVDYLARSREIGLAAGLARDQIVLDPGIGFGKTLDHNLTILRNLHAFRALGQPLLVGTSRKSFIGHLTGRPVQDRVFGTAATVALAVAQGADIVRVHDVAAMAQVVRVSDAIVRGCEREHLAQLNTDEHR